MNIYTHEEIKTPITKVEKAKRKTKKERASISPSEILTMMEEVESQFIRPEPQDLLNGELGVTLFDIAQSLGASHAEIKRRFERSGEPEYCQAFGYKTMITIIVPAAGPRADSYVLDMAAAQSFISKYDNFRGRSYLHYLIKCKDALTVSLIELEKKTAQIEYLKKKVTESEQREAEPKRIRKKPEHKVVVGEEFSTYDSEGLKKVAKVTAKTLDEMTNTERGLYNIQQNTKKELGLHKKIVRLLIDHKCSDKNILHEADLCLDALENFNSLVNKTGLERAMEPKKEYLQPQLFATGEKPKYIN